MTRTWWQDAVVYQIYVRSFADGDADGIGDLVGIRSRIGYLTSLGVDAIWLTPCYPSPQLDHGYDVANYFDINPQYGDLATFDSLVAECRAAGIRVLMDVVPNHCSAEHHWFTQALQDGPNSHARSRFFFRDGRGEHGELPPNNWTAVFGGSAWTRVTESDGSLGQWYLHTFTPWQPDFDWDSHDVIEHFDDMLQFWFDRGVDGFRVDAVTVLGKAPGLPDSPPMATDIRDTAVWSHNPYSVFWPSGHVTWRHWRAVIDQYVAEHPERDLMMVAEAYTPGRPDLLLQYVAPDEFHQSFSFDLMLSPWNARMIRDAITDSIDALGKVGIAPTWTLNNHDTQRAVTRYGRADATSPASWTGNNLLYSDVPVDIEIGRVRARAGITLAAALPGSLYLYQGEELGLAEVLDLPDTARTDPIFTRTDGRETGRDGCRVPLPWTADPADAFGFAAGPCTPWLPQPADWGRYAVNVQDDDPSSMLALYRTVLAARSLLLDPTAPLSWILANQPALIAFRRGTICVILNPTVVPVVVEGDDLAAMRVVVSSRPGHADPRVIPDDTCLWLAPLA